MHSKCSKYTVNTSDKQSEFTDSPLRADLQIRDNTNKKIFLIDFKCPMSQPTERKHIILIWPKYSGLRDHISEIILSWKIIINTFIVTYFGSCVPNNDKIFYDIDFREQHIREISSDSVKSNMK